ncbi:hypothetical protein BK666_04160 [Pseudomonas frederiksbergensis]|uniref:Uncharacterized protein n=1 Tax=Pseudomonas frederiksbergensis TaxID=104087 RepID=A0A423KF14_9PSED|nr:hypothetical protein [Pseudomonas frederiksbergensis]RON51446.1 hypothetical protein BK666_04160 [Pseudomonas frederiksbergensis]
MNNVTNISKNDIEALRPTIETFNKKEKESIADKLRALNNPLPAELLLCELQVPCTTGSSLDIVHKKERGLLLDMMNTSEFKTVCRLLCVPQDALFYCDEFRNLYAKTGDRRQNLTHLIDNHGRLSAHLDLLTLATLRCGRFIYSATDISVEQWHNFYGVAFAAHLKRIAGPLIPIKFPRAKTFNLGNYRELVNKSSPSPLTLTDEQRAHLASGASTLSRLLDPSRAVDIIRFNPRAELGRLFTTVNAQRQAAAWLRHVGWYGAAASETPSDADLYSLLVAGLLLEIDPSIGRDDSDQNLFGYALYAPQNTEMNRQQVMIALERQLITCGIAQPLSAPIVAHLLLAAIAPEFVVRGVPDSLLLGTTGWISLSHAAAHIETMIPGACCVMTYDEVMRYAQSQLVNAEQDELYTTMIIRPLLNWAALNGEIRYNPQGDYTKEDFIRASRRHDDYIESLRKCAEGLSTPLPTRESLARKELEKALPADQGVLERKVLRTHTYSVVPNANRHVPYEHSLLELYMSGDLLNAQGDGLSYDFRHDQSIAWLKEPQQYFRKLNNNLLGTFNETFEAYFSALSDALSTNARLTLSRLPLKDRLPLEYGDVNVYGVRKKIDNNRPFETENERKKARAKYGVIIRSHYQDKLHYYELFTLRGECYLQPAFQRLLDIPFTLQGRDDDYLSRIDIFSIAEEEHFPLDYNAYFSATRPITGTTSSVVVDLLWQRAMIKSGNTSISSLETFYSPRIAELVKKIFEVCPPINHDDLYEAAKGITLLERQRNQNVDNFHQVLNLIIPFKGCIEDLTSGDPEREVAGAVGCVLDGLSVMGAVLGTAPKILSVAMRAGSRASKVFSLGKVGAGFVASLINPLDGFPELVTAGTALTKKGTLLLSRSARSETARAAAHLRELNIVGQSKDISHTLNNPQVKQAKWLTYDNATTLFNLLIIKKGTDWYLLDLATMAPRGPKLNLSDFNILP